MRRDTSGDILRDLYYFFCSIGAWIIDHPNILFYTWLVLLSYFFHIIGYCIVGCLLCEINRRYSDGGHSSSGP